MKKYVLLLLILVVGFCLRFYKLGVVPNGLYQDETAIGYNAYSILTTGKDEYGTPFPLYFKSFGDYKLPVYIYATVPSIAIFGMTPFAVRFPSALFGFLTIPLLYLLVFTLSKNKNFALAAMGLLAINPWHIHYSRATFEVTLALFFFLLGTYWLISQKKGYFLFGTLCFIAALYSYNVTRLLAPLLYISVVYLFYQKIRKNEIMLTTLITLILLLPFFVTLLTSGGFVSSKGTLIFSSAAVQAPLLEFRSHMILLPALFSKIFFNSFVLTAWQYIYNVAAYFSVPFFFLTGSTHGNHGIGTIGQFYLFELPLMCFGAMLLFKRKDAMSKLVALWFIATILVASLTREAPHATRSFFLLFPMTVASAAGFLWVLSKGKIIILISFLFISYNSLLYLASYFVRFPIYYAKSWRSEDAALSSFILDHQEKYQHILIDKNAGFVYTSYLFYSLFPTKDFQTAVQRLPDDSEGFSEVTSFGKFEIRDINWEKDMQRPYTLIVTTDKKPANLPTLETFYYPKRPVVAALKQTLMIYPTQEIAYMIVESPTPQSDR